MQHPFTLYEDELAKVVQLEGEYSTQWGCLIDELKAVFYASGLIELHRFKNCADDEVTRFKLSENEIAAFFESWETLKAEKELKKLVEEKRVANIVQQAKELIGKYPITIEEHGETDGLCWDIHCDAAAVHTCAYSAEALLERVKETVEAQAWIEEAHKIAKDSHVIHITEGDAPWHVNIPEPDLFGQWACNPAHLLEVTKKAKEVYEQWQTEQDALIKTND